MESLLCNESWDMMSPNTTNHDHIHARTQRWNPQNHNSCISSFYTTNEDCQNAFRIYLAKEVSYMPQLGYQDQLKSDIFLAITRFKGIQWLIDCQRRLNLSLGTVFAAANCLDRFISANQYNEYWKYCTVELLSVACLSISSKFGETDPPSLHEIQGEDLNCSFEPGLIQRMELMLLKDLEWRVGSTTAYSYVELLAQNFDFAKPYLVHELTTQVNNLLLQTLFDIEFLGFRPSVIAISATRFIFEKLFQTKYDDQLITLIPENQTVDLIECQKIIKEKLILYYYFPSSSALAIEDEVRIWDCGFGHFSLVKMPDLRIKSGKKRKKRGVELSDNE